MKATQWAPSLVLAAAVALGLAEAPTVRAESVSVLLEKGIYTEETAGDVDGAIKIYEQIISESDANRRYVAQARLRLGLCQLKKKRTAQARAEFEKLIAEFPDQKELVAEARKHLPADAFPEIEGCRVIKRIEAVLAPTGVPGSGKVPATIYEDDLLEVAWNVPAEVLAQVKGWSVTIQSAGSDEKSALRRWTTADSSTRSVRYSVQQFGSAAAKPLQAGDYIVEVLASSSGEVNEKAPVASAQVKFAIKPIVYTQINIDEILTDGTIQGRNVIHESNNTGKPIETIGFMNSDFVNTTRMTDENGQPIEFTTKHEGSTYRYRAKLNKPVAPGELMAYSSESTKSGLVKPVRGKKDVFEYRMQHWPSAAHPTRRIEVFRLPAGAQVVDTTPSTMSRRVKDGRTELSVEKIIPTGGSILTVIRYELTGAATSPASPAALLRIEAAPWVDGEQMQLRIVSMAGGELGMILYWADSTEVNGKPAWRVQSEMMISVNNMLQYTDVLADRDSFAPFTGVTLNSELGDMRAVYAPQSVEVTSKESGKENTRKVDIEGPVYDNEQVLYMMRRLPLAKGYQARFDIFPVMGGAVMEGRIDIKEIEKVTVAAGTYDCYRIVLQVYADGVRALEHKVWMSADEHKYLVKYDSGAAIMELAKVEKIEKDKPVTYADSDLRITLQAPAGWHFYKNPGGRDVQKTVQLLVPEQQAWALLATQVHLGDAGTAKSVAEGDIESLKGFFKDYTVRADSWKELKLAGMPAARFVADYKEKDGDKVEYRTYILGAKAIYWFVFRVEKSQFEQQKATFDKLMDGFKVAQ